MDTNFKNFIENTINLHDLHMCLSVETTFDTDRDQISWDNDVDVINVYYFFWFNQPTRLLHPIYLFGSWEYYKSEELL